MAVKMAVKTAVEMAPGAIPRPAGCRNREFCPPNWTFAMAAALDGFLCFRLFSRCFEVRDEYIGGEAAQGGGWGPHTIGPRGPGSGRAGLG